MPQTPQQSDTQGWLAGLFQHIFDRIGLNGIPGVQRAQQQAQPDTNQQQHMMSDSEMRQHGFSEADIAYYHKMIQQSQGR